MQYRTPSLNFTPRRHGGKIWDSGTDNWVDSPWYAMPVPLPGVPYYWVQKYATDKFCIAFCCVLMFRSSPGGNPHFATSGISESSGEESSESGEELDGVSQSSVGQVRWIWSAPLGIANLLMDISASSSLRLVFIIVTWYHHKMSIRLNPDNFTSAVDQQS